MKILALDYGDKRIGLALGDTEAHVAVPYGILENRGRTYALHQLKILLKDEGIEKILIGIPLPLHARRRIDEMRLKDIANPVRDRSPQGDRSHAPGMAVSNGANAQMQKTLRFIDDVRDAIATPVVTIDERLSTREADNRTRNTPQNVRAPRDAIAAAIILQSYLDRSNHE